MSRGHTAGTHSRSVYVDLRNCTTCLAIAAAQEASHAAAQQRHQALQVGRQLLREQQRERILREMQMGAIERLVRRGGRTIAAVALTFAGTFCAFWLVLSATDAHDIRTPVSTVVGVLVGLTFGLVVAVENEKDHYLPRRELARPDASGVSAD